MVKRYNRVEDALDPARPVAEPTTFIGDDDVGELINALMAKKGIPRHLATAVVLSRARTCGSFLYIIAKVQADLPLSADDRDFILGVLRRYCLTPKEHAAFLRAAKQRYIEIAKKLAKTVVYRGEQERPATFVARGKQEQWVQEIHRFPTRAALRQFVKRERKHRR